MILIFKPMKMGTMNKQWASGCHRFEVLLVKVQHFCTLKYFKALLNKQNPRPRADFNL